MAETRYSRIPLYGEGPDDIVGMVEVRDLVAFEGTEDGAARELSRPVHLVPETRKTTVRGPVRTCSASRRLPGPASFRFVTSTTAPPRPPGVSEPKPSAPGKATGWALAVQFGTRSASTRSRLRRRGGNQEDPACEES